jgi:hypothetical protein
MKDVESSIEKATGMRLLEGGTLHILDGSEWNERREKLAGSAVPRACL